jgi:hypothetical protein
MYLVSIYSTKSSAFSERPMQKSAIWAILLLTIIIQPAASQSPQNPFEIPIAAVPQGKIDELVFSRLKMLGVQPAHPCSDAVFIRRVYLDAIGTLPGEQEVKDFLSSRNPDKRSALIDRLLGREEFADYWAMKWSDLLRVKSEFPVNLWPNAVQAFHRWIRTAIKQNMPYDQFVREMLTASGSNFRVPQVNFYRAVRKKEPKVIAQAVALTFMGTRAEKWPETRLSGMAAFFSQIAYKSTAEWKEEIVIWSEGSARKDLSKAVFPDGKPARILPNRDPREIFADWLIDPKNPWFTRNVANRVWSWLLGRGIIHEPDDMRPENPPINPELLACLEQKLIQSHYDLKSLVRLILNSETYQLSSIPAPNSAAAENSFAFYSLRRLEAEVLIDALDQITGTTEQYSSAIPEPFTFIPENRRSIALADASITSPFFETFGRPPRDTGLELERNNTPTAAQRLHMLNSSHIERKIEQGPRLLALLKQPGGGQVLINDLYLTILSRYPTEAEAKKAVAYYQSYTGNKREALVDIVWALINGAEFICRH